ncbi:hypothetical protein BGW42_007363 [Actinomortierella wolfii]|nr:hypothetical protein BGW42_007363 [Actinomortierella wolfii]
MPRQQHPRFQTYDGSTPIHLSISPFDSKGRATMTFTLSKGNNSDVQAGLINSSVYIPKQFRIPYLGQRHSSPGECDLVLKIFPRIPLTREASPVTKDGVLISSGVLAVCEQCKAKRTSLFQLQGIVETSGPEGITIEALDSQRLPLANEEVRLELRICCPPNHHTFLSDPIGYVSKALAL